MTYSKTFLKNETNNSMKILISYNSLIIATYKHSGFFNAFSLLDGTDGKAVTSLLGETKPVYYIFHHIILYKI